MGRVRGWRTVPFKAPNLHPPPQLYVLYHLTVFEPNLISSCFLRQFPFCARVIWAHWARRWVSLPSLVVSEMQKLW